MTLATRVSSKSGGEATSWLAGSTGTCGTVACGAGPCGSGTGGTVFCFLDLALFLRLSPDAAAAIAVAKGRRERNGRFGGILHCKEKRGLAERKSNSIILIKLMFYYELVLGKIKKLTGKVCQT